MWMCLMGVWTCHCAMTSMAPDLSPTTSSAQLLRPWILKLEGFKESCVIFPGEHNLTFTLLLHAKLLEASTPFPPTQSWLVVPFPKFLIGFPEPWRLTHCLFSWFCSWTPSLNLRSTYQLALGNLTTSLKLSARPPARFPGCWALQGVRKLRNYLSSLLLLSALCSACLASTTMF